MLRLLGGIFARLAGDRETAREHLERVVVDNDSEARSWIVDNGDAFFAAAYLIDIYREMGDSDSAEELHRIATRHLQMQAWGTGGQWQQAYRQAWADGAIGDLESMKTRLKKAADKGGQSMHWSPWGIMLTRHADDPEVAELLRRLDARREEVRQTLVAEGLISAENNAEIG